ncbi:MAG: PD40 domain-containing protein [Rhizobacter sp.]|nr:PD40 domain-containing protein [Chlorobiales bacterium]
MMKRFLLSAAALLTLALLSPQTSQAQYFSFGKNKVQYKNFEWSYVQSEHFDVYFTEGGEYLGKFTADAAEAAYESIKKDFKYEVNSRIALMVYKSHNDFQQTNVIGEYLDEGIGGVTELYKNRIVVPFEGNYKQFRHVIHHELVHAVVNDMIYGGSVQSAIVNNIRVQIPLWFNEGIAEYEALGWDTNADMWINDAIMNNYLPPIQYLGGYFAYRGGQSMWKFIGDKYGREKVSEIMQRLRGSRNVEFAFRGSLGLSVEELSEKWLREQKVNYWPEIALREDPNATMKKLTDHRKDGSNYNMSPAISPQGDKFAFKTNRNGFFDIYVGSTLNPQESRRLAAGQLSPNLEELKVLTPGITWSPDGRRVAVSTKAGEQDAVLLIDVATGKTEKLTFELDGIFSIDWSRDGQWIAFNGNHDYKSDIYAYNLTTKELLNLTNDVFSDSDPAFSPDGKKVYFASDRRENLNVATKSIAIRNGKFESQASTKEQFKMRLHDYSQMDLYEYSTETRTLRRLTATDFVDETSPVLSPDGQRVVFISDRNGNHNVYELTLTPSPTPVATASAGVYDSTLGFKSRAITNVITGIQQISMSYDGNKLIGVCLDYAGFDIFMLRNPLEREPRNMIATSGEIPPTTWGRKIADLRAAKLLQPSLAEAMKASAFDVKPQIDLRQSALGDGAMGITGDTAKKTAPKSPTVSVDTAKSDVVVAQPQTDTSAYKDVRLDFKNFVFDRDYSGQPAGPTDEEREAKTAPPKNNVTADGDYRVRKYKLSFSPDIVYGQAGYSAFYGAQGSAVFSFSDLLGNHQIFLSTNLQLDLRNSNYALQYLYLAERTDFGLSGFHNANFLQLTDPVGGYAIYRYRVYGGSLSASYPFDRFTRLDASAGYLEISKENLDGIYGTERTGFFYPTLTYTFDNSRPFLYSPISGTRFAMSLTGGAGPRIQFGSLLADYRTYFDFFQYYSFVIRASGGYSFGNTPQKFFIGGTENWINREFQNNQIPITDIQDFIFTTPAIPMRGFNYNARNGTNFALMNMELRFPFLQYLAVGPIPIPFYYVQGAVFLDVGSAWTGDNFKLSSVGDDGKSRLNDLLVGTGWGVRTVVLYFPVRFDMAWSYDLQGFSQPKYYISIGTDF